MNFNCFYGDIELQEVRSIDQHVKVNWPPVDGAQTDAQSPAIIDFPSNKAQPHHKREEKLC